MRNLSRLCCVLGLASLALAVSCRKKSSDSLSDEGSRLSGGYYPAYLGKSVTYDVDSVRYNDSNCQTIVSHYQLQYTLADTFRDEQGRRSFVVQKRYRKNAQTPWERFRDVDLVSIDPNGVRYKSATLDFQSLVFPVTEDRTWSGNAFINTSDSAFSYFAGWDYQYKRVDADFLEDSVQFRNTVTVEQTDDKVGDIEDAPARFASRTNAREVYAQGIGLVYKTITHWVYTPPLKACKRGYSVRMRAVEY